MKRKTWTFPPTCRKGHPYGPNPPRDRLGCRVCVQCRLTGLCEHCKLRPPNRHGSRFCSKACSNSARLVPLADRFLLYYQPGDPDSCWPWAGTIDRNGYGVIGDEKRRQIRAHRIAYERANGPIPPERNVLHRCDNPPCCNPAHLFVGTTADNNEDRRRKGRYASGQTHPLAKLTADNVRDIRAKYAKQGGGKEIAAEFGVSRDTVYDIVYRRRWTHID